MRIWTWSVRCGAVAMALILTSCASGGSIRSNKMPSYTAMPKKIFVESDVGRALAYKISGDERIVFGSLFVDGLAKCGTQAVVHEKDALALTDNIDKRIQEFRPDAILQIATRSEGTRGVAVVSAVYVLTLIDVETKSAVWRAEIDFVSNWYPGKALAGIIFDRLKEDRIIDSSCEVPKA